MELIKVGEKTYYIKNNTNIGIYKIDEDSVYLIDTGNDESAAKKILKIINENNWHVLGIISTHSNADHIGGNALIQKRCNCPVYAYGLEKYFIENPILEPLFLYGSLPFKDLENKFLKADSSINVLDINELNINGLEHFNLKGHFLDMIGIKTSDNVYFIADSLFNENTISKYHLFFIYDVLEYLKTLNYLKTINGLFIPSHGEVTNDIFFWKGVRMKFLI